MPEYVYILRHGKTNVFKIGITRDVGDRINSLQTGNPVELSLELSQEMPFNVSARDVEKALHKELAILNVRGEWFHIPGHVWPKVRRSLENMISALRVEAELCKSNLSRTRFSAEISDVPSGFRHFEELELPFVQVSKALSAMAKGVSDSRIIEDIFEMRGRHYLNGKAKLEQLKRLMEELDQDGE